MAKKKTNNIVINDQELIPTTLGTYSNKAKSPVIVFFILAIFLSIAFFMPDIQTYINKLQGKSTNTGNNGGNNNNNNPNNPDNPDNPDNPVPNEVEKYDINETTVITENNFEISGISNINDVLTLTVSSSSGANLNQYFIELYNADNMLLGRVKLSDETLSSDGKATYTYDIPENASKMSVVKKTSADYPDVNIAYNDKNEGILTCTNKYGEEYIYTFTQDQLGKIVYTYKVSSTNVNYSDEYNKYLSLDSKYKVIDNVTSSLINSDNGFDYTLSLNLNEISQDSISEIKLTGIYKIKTSPKEVKFISEAKGYTCDL